MPRSHGLQAAAAVCLAMVVTGGVSQAADAVECDVNGDGFGDLAVGAPGMTHHNRRGAGEVAVFLGSISGLPHDPAFILRAGTNGLPGKARNHAAFGAAIGCGDFNGDGMADLVIGAPGERVGDMTAAGAVYAVYGSRTLPPATAARFTARPVGLAIENAAFGFAVAVGDLDDDGIGDAAIGVPGKNAVVTLAGSLDGLHGAGATRYASADMHKLGAALAVGDVNGDDEPDLIAGAPNADVAGKRAAGVIALWLGGDPSSADPEVISRDTRGIAGRARQGARFGWSVAVGDHDADGFDDAAVGAPGHRVGTVNRAGDVVLIHGRAAGLGARDHQYNLRNLGIGAGHKDGFGWAIALADLTGNGTMELIVGAPRRHGLRPREGFLTVIPHAGAALHATLDTLGQPIQSGHGLGGNIMARDFDGNGRADLALGMQGAGLERLQSGAVALIYGRKSLHLNPPGQRETTLHGRKTGARFGVVGAGQAPTDLPLLSVKMFDREEWGARDPIVSRLTRHKITRLTIHHAGGSGSEPGPAVYRVWQEWHMDHWRWGDVAYHIIIGADGRVFAARPKGYRGDTGTNYDPTGHLLVVVEGNFDDNEPTAIQLDLLPKVVAWAATRYDFNLDEVMGHRDHAATTCPGANLYPYIASGDLAADVAALLDLGRVILDT